MQTRVGVAAIGEDATLTGKMGQSGVRSNAHNRYSRACIENTENSTEEGRNDQVFFFGQRLPE